MSSWEKIVDSLSERIRHPFLLAYAISAILINFRILIVVFGDGAYQDKLTYIDSVLYPSLDASLQAFILKPAIAASIYVFGWPLLDIVVSALAATVNQFRQVTALKIERYYARQLLKAAGREVVPRDELEAFFSKQSTALEEANRKRVAAMQTADQLRSNAEQEGKILRNRILDQARLRAEAATGLSHAILADSGMTISGENAIKIKSLPHFQSLLRLIKASKGRQLTDENEIEVSDQWIARVIDADRPSSEMLDLFESLGYLSRGREPNTYNIYKIVFHGSGYLRLADQDDDGAAHLPNPVSPS